MPVNLREAAQEIDGGIEEIWPADIVTRLGTAMMYTLAISPALADTGRSL